MNSFTFWLKEIMSKILQKAIDAARNIPYVKGRQRHFSVILSKRGRILAEGENSYTKTSPKMKRAGERVGLPDKVFWHAECKAIYSLKEGAKAYKIVVVRVDSEGNPVHSAPCPLCQVLIKEAGIKVVEYTV